MSQPSMIKVEQDGALRIISLNRPEKLNAITVQMDLDFVRAMRAAETDSTVRSILIRGEGKSFSAGHDLIEVGQIMHELGDKATDWTNVYNRVWPEGSPVQVICDSDKPVIVATKGYVVGMMVPAVLCADMVVAADDTVFHLEVLRSGGGAGLSPYLGLLPHKLINEIAFLGQLTAQQLLMAGAINRVTPLAELDEVALGVARGSANVLPVSIQHFKRGIRNLLRTQGIGDPDSMRLGGVESHGNETDNGFWKMAADKGVTAALRWRDEQTAG